MAFITLSHLQILKTYGRFSLKHHVKALLAQDISSYSLMLYSEENNAKRW